MQKNKRLRGLLMDNIIQVILFLTPRYVTDRVALNNTDEVWSVVCLEGQVQDGDVIHAYGTIRTFTWFGISRGGMVKLDE
jgi:hypothetical protein